MVSPLSMGLVSLCLLSAALPGGTSLVLTDIRLPSYIVRGHSGVLRCEFEANGQEIYSIKWYKDNKEFFRYHPEQPKPLLTFHSEGFTVNNSQFKIKGQDLRWDRVWTNEIGTRSTARELHMDRVDLDAAGWYKCEVTSGPPMFLTVEKSKKLHVVDLPDAIPFIRGHREAYRVGEVMRLNCSSYRSYPPVRLHWYVNEEPVAWTSVEEWTNPEPFQMTTTFSRLTHTVSPEDFNNGQMRVRCTASMNGTDYWESQEIAASRLIRQRAKSEHHVSSAAPKTKPTLSLVQVFRVFCAVLALWLA